MYIEFLKFRVYPAAVVITSMMGSVVSPVYAYQEPYKQTFVITAYYSPEPDQCCYFRGNYVDEISFNGKGTNGADGTAVYPGMIAAPDSYAFGTVIDLPGVGIGTVHDRGGRIIEWGDDLHRIDLWMGTGEEGLARALAWGTRKVTGTVYPAGWQGTPAERFVLSDFNADSSVLRSIPKSDPVLLMIGLVFGDSRYGVRLLQQALKSLGYFKDAVTGTYGEVTKQSLRQFLAEYGLPGDGGITDSTIVAAITVASGISEENLPVIKLGLQKGDSGAAVRQIQKLLRYVGAYRGRTDGIFDEDVKEAVLAFQKQKGLVASAGDTGAGRMGPMTRRALLASWKSKVVKAQARLVAMKLDVRKDTVASGLPAKTLAKGAHNADVRTVQRALVTLGYLPEQDATGTFGERTAAALLRYQKDKGIIASDKQKGAGVFGPATRSVLVSDLADATWKKMRAGSL